MSAALQMSRRELNRAVLSRQHLIDRLPSGTSVINAVGAIGPLQAQYNPSPFLALLARVDGFRSEELRSALDSQLAVKASLMRGTLHVVGAGQYPMYASTLGGPITRLWNTWVGKLLDVEPMQAALLELTDPGPCSRGEVIEFCQRWAGDHFPPDAIWNPVGSWFFARCSRPCGDVEVPVRLLPKFDSLMLAYVPPNRGRTLPPAYYDEVIKTVNGQVMATILVDGMVAGTWTVATSRTAVEIAISTLGRWAKGARAEVRAEAERIGEFLAGADPADRDVRVRFG